MPKHLFNYCPIQYYEDELQTRNMTLEDIIAALGVDGIEQLVYKTQGTTERYKNVSVGVHLCFWMYWLDFWLKKAKRLKYQFHTIHERNEYFKDAMGRDEWLSVIRRNLLEAQKQEPEYLVWHVADVSNQEAFTYDFHYSDREVLTAAADVFNAVADEIHLDIPVLFENLWWPGLRLTDVDAVAYFFERIQRKNVGIMLDTGHLMNTNSRLRTEAEAADYVCQVYNNLGVWRSLVKGVHLSCSLSGEYIESFPKKVPAKLDDAMIWAHIIKVDQHRPFGTTAAKQILDCIQPEFVVHELVYNSLEEMQNLVAGQLSVAR